MNGMRSRGHWWWLYQLFFKWLQIDGSSPFGIHFGRRNGIVVVCLSSQMALATATLGWIWATLVPLSSSLTKPFRTGPGHSLLPCPSCLALTFPSHFKLLQWLEFLNYSVPLHPSETLHMLLIFLECFLPVVSLFLFQNLVQLSLPPKSLFIYLFIFLPSCPGLCSIALSHHAAISFFSHLSPLLGLS